MCGIAGQLTFRGYPDIDLVKRMSARLAHRGPDDQGFFSDNQIALAHRRLAIIDLSPEAAQPMVNEDRTLWIVYNGEIYNYIELREVLAGRGHPFRTGTDTEVILAAYREWGYDCLSHFNGMWAFALWDTDKEELFCARDRLGVKPFYYAIADGSFLFASEIKALLEHPAVGKKPYNPAFLEYLAYGSADHSEKTMFEGVLQLPPAHFMVIDKSSTIRPVQYWVVRVNMGHSMPGLQDSDAANAFLNHLFRSVRLRLRSDVPVGSCLSGGIDSSSIVMIINRILLNEHPESIGNHQKTFSVVFPGTAYDESKYIQQITESSGVETYTSTPDPAQLWEDLGDLLYYQDEPFASLSIYAQYVLMRLAAQKVKVVLDGQGADELLGGYLAYQVPYISGLLKKGHFMSGFYELTGSLKRHWKFFVWAMNQKRIRAGRRGLVEKISSVPDRYSGTLDEVLTNELTRNNLPLLLHWEDRNSMAFSIEARVPFLDYQLVEYAASLPLNQKIRSGVTKLVLRNAVVGLIPEPVRCRRDKMGFVTPEEIWMKGVLHPFITTILFSDRFSSRPYWNAGRVRDEYQQYIDGKSPYSPELWRIICAELWLRTFFDSGTIAK